jgi:hypothetical protein
MPDWLASRFSLVGLVAVVIQQAPGIVWAIHPPRVDPFAENSGTFLVEILEKTFGIATIVLLVIVVAHRPMLHSLSAACAVAAFVVLAVYYAFYIAYYRGVTSLTVLLGMALCPALCFLLVAMSQGNVPAVLTSVVFGAVHVGLTYANFAPRW